MEIERPPSARLIWHFDDGMDGMLEVYRDLQQKNGRNWTQIVKKDFQDDQFLLRIWTIFILLQTNLALKSLKHQTSWFLSSRKI